MKRALSAPVSVLLLALGLTACGSGTGQPSPSATPTPSTSATATATPSPTPSAVYKPATATSKAKNVPVPVMPEAAKAQTPDGAKAFVGYWVAALSYAYETGDTKLVKALSAPDCQLCQSMAQALDEQWRAGGWIEGGQLRSPAAEVKAAPNPDRVTLIAQVNQEPFSVHKADGTLAEQQTAKSVLSLAFVVDRLDGSWKIRDAKRWVG